ncbi:homoserine O-acetyltransferase/O-succinyltransferase family protein [Lactiplantibacillus songbeiensis]|uniref:Homoserine O-acetyltransferase n=1 Tax=Lactiplantibacillus songbeiensis TaxID=2559920 RepID=A0ABW4C0J0_9LACO|nr:homoserine O-succinyltransferase [Lactiplantibacillus songbeiensis]
MTVTAVNGLLKAQQKWINQPQGGAPMRLLILNLMPTKVTTERQFLSNFAAVPGDFEITFMYPATHQFKSLSRETVAAAYVSLDQVYDQHFDGLIITGAPVEKIDFEAVDYWDEFGTIVDWAQTHVTQTLFECWAAQAGLYYQFNIQKRLVAQKIFGIYMATSLDEQSQLAHNLSAGGLLKMPQSRHTQLVLPTTVPSDLHVVATNDEIGPLIITAPAANAVYVTGHPEYDTDTLANEYFRDQRKHLPIELPKYYFKNKNLQTINDSWHQTSHQLYANWIETLKLTKVGL